MKTVITARFIAEPSDTVTVEHTHDEYVLGAKMVALGWRILIAKTIHEKLAR